MTDYRRNRVPGGTYVFAVNLYYRRLSLLTLHIETLRQSVRKIRAQYSFHIAAWAMLPDPFHCL